MKAIIWAIVAFFATLGLSMTIFLPKVLELPAGEKAGLYSNIWLLGTFTVCVIFALIAFRLLGRRGNI